jgi:hypothetical protein
VEVETTIAFLTCIQAEIRYFASFFIMASWLPEMEMTLVEFRFGNSFIAILYLENVG